VKNKKPPLVELWLAESLCDAWENVIVPWCDRVLPDCWNRKSPAVIVVPTRGEANALKERLLRHGRSYLGLHFVTPTALRELVGADDRVQLPNPADLRLLLAIAAAESPHDPTAKSVARSPGPLLRALDRLEIAGWKFDRLALGSFVPLVRRFEQLMKQCRFALSGEVDRQRWQQARTNAPKFSDILVTGFDGAHWANWFLLRAAVAWSENATVVLEEPHDFSDIELCWIGSWEEAAGEAKRATKPAPATADSLFTEAEMRGDAKAEPRFDFLVGINFADQARAIAHQCLKYLAEENCTRLGVIFPGNGALPRLVSSALEGLEIPHNDNVAHIVPGIFETAEWQAWLELQRTPRLNSFLSFFNALPDTSGLAPALSRHSLERILRESYSEVLLDDLEILRAHCASGLDEKRQVAAQVLSALQFLPSRGTISEFLERTFAALAQLGWNQHALEIANTDRQWPQRLEMKISRTLFLRWLQETAATLGAARSPAGDHPYARVQLLTIPHAQNQEWSHLILAGWNEGAWPPPAGAEFAREEEIHAFNTSVQQLNKRAARQGSQGEGQMAVRENHSLYLGPVEQRAIALRQFEALLESASEAITLTASLVHEDAPERPWNPSECLSKLYLRERRQPLTQAMMKDLQHGTALLPGAAMSRADVQQTLVAFSARRNNLERAGEYDFALRPDGSYRPVPTLSVSDLERTVSFPAIIWMKRYLGVEEPQDTANPWAATSGKWVHRWLAAIGETRAGKIFMLFPPSEIIDERIRLSADDGRAALQQLCSSLNKSIPDWWTSGWLNARYLARHLGGKIAGAEGWKWMATEFPVGREGPVRIGDSVELHLRGQIDLILSQNDSPDFAGEKLWVVDYKTGSTKKLSTGDLHDTLVKGTTLQLGLYSLALREMGAAEVGASILSSAVRQVAPQMAVTELLPHTDIFGDLAEMQRTGIFGMKGELRATYGQSATYPLATLPIDPDILEDKWARTHPKLVLEKEEWEVF
jgi:hypothetical protein